MAVTSFSPEREVLASIITTLAADSELTTETGIDPDTGNPRTVPVFGVPEPHAPAPFIAVQIGAPRSPIGGPTFDVATKQSGADFVVNVTVYSDTADECLALANRIVDLLNHFDIDTEHWTGRGKYLTLDPFEDDISEPDKVMQRAGIRVRALVRAK